MADADGEGVKNPKEPQTHTNQYVFPLPFPVGDPGKTLGVREHTGKRVFPTHANSNIEVEIFLFFLF